MNSNHTRKSLTASIISIFLCLILLIGTTFAWFTDSVTSGNNRIAAGNLDVELEYLSGDQWLPVTADTNLFSSADDTLWEPGHTEYTQLRIRNAGTLALTYSFTVNVYGDTNGGAEKEYTNVNGDKFKLSDYIVFTKKDGQQNVTAREDLWLDSAAEKEAMGDTSGLAGNDDLLEPNASEVFTVAAYMPTSVGNEANQSTAARTAEGAPEIYLGLTLNATQAPYEEDSFGDDYDNAAAVSTAEELEKAIAAGGNVVLWNDIQVDNRLAVSSETTLDLNGRTITFGGDYATTGASGDVTPIRVNAGGSLTITGNGTIDASEASDYVVPVSVMQAGGTVLIENGTIIVDSPRESCVFAMGGNVTINGGTFINKSTEDYAYGDGAPLTLNLSNGNPGSITVYGGVFEGRDPASGDDNLKGTFVASGYVSKKVSDGRFVVVKEGTETVTNGSQMQDAVSSGADTIAVVGEVRLESQININRDLTIDGLGSGEITGMPIRTTADVTFKDVTLSKLNNSNKNATSVYAQNGCVNLTFEGCTFTDPQWEVMQITSTDFESLVINDCTFTAADVDVVESPDYGNASDQAIRYIHIQPPDDANVIADVTITNSVFKNCDKVCAVAGIFYLDSGSTVTVGGNTFENLSVTDGVSNQMGVGWPNLDVFKEVATWTGAITKHTI